MTVPYNSESQQTRTHPHPLAVHRCRFVDFTPAAITSIAFPPLSLPSKRDRDGKKRSQNHQHQQRHRRYAPMAVGRANGNIEILEWAMPEHEQEKEPQAAQAWVLSKILYGPNPSKVDSLAFALRYPHLHTHEEVPSLEDLRLFSVGGGNELVEWDVNSGTILRTLSSQGGAIWSMAVNPANTQLALGCEDGRVRLLDISAGSLEHGRRFDRIKARLLSIAWGPPTPPTLTKKQEDVNDDDSEDDDDDSEWTDSFLVTGGSDSSLRKWDAKTGRVLERMTVDKARGERTLVWTVGVLGDGTIVSGDSLGMVKFWDSWTCTQLHSFPAHGADVLCLAVGPDGKSVYTSGVDQKVCLFSHVRLTNPDKTTSLIARPSSRWVQSTSKRLHSHDVRALAIWPPYTPIASSNKASSSASSSSPFSGTAPILASGGLDASLVLAPCASASSGAPLVNPLKTSTESTFENAYHRRVAYPTGLNPSVSIAREARLMICARETSLSIWKILGKARVSSALEVDLLAAEGGMKVDGSGSSSGEKVKVKGEEECGYERVLDMEFDTTTNLSASAISGDGRWLAVSDAYEVKLFELIQPSTSDTTNEKENLRPRRVKTFASIQESHLGVVEGASTLGFTPDGGRLVLAGARSGWVVIVDLTSRSETGKPEPRVLRSFEHHARRLMSSGRVVKPIPGRAGDGAEGDEGEDAAMAGNEEATGEEEASEEEDEDEEERSVLVTRLAFSADGQWLATTDNRFRTHIFNLDSVQHHTTLPTSPTNVAALAFVPPLSGVGAPLLLLAHVDSTIGVFDVEARHFPEWAAHLARRSALPQRWTNLHDAILGITVEPPPPSSSSEGMTEKPDTAHAIFWGSTWLCRIALDAPVGWGGFIRKRRRGAGGGPAADATHGYNKIKERGSLGEEEEEEMRNFKLVTRYRPILCADFLEAGEIVVVERPLVDVLQSLPPAYFKPRYGT